MVQKSILQISDFGAPYPGNFLASLQALDPFLRQEGWRQIYIFPERAQKREWLARLQKRGLPIYIMPDSTLFERSLFICDVAKKENSCILHTHFTYNDIAASVATLLLRLMGIKAKVIWHVHSPWLANNSLPRRIKDFIKYCILGRIAHSVVVSEGGLQNMMTRGLPKNRAAVILNGIDIGRVTAQNRLRRDVREEFGIDEAKKVILMFGRDPVIKGVDIALQAFAETARQRNDFVVVMVGAKHLENSQNYAMNLLGTIPKWLRIVEPRQCVADYYGAADLFISASRWEGFPYAVLEAMANGLPIISSDIHGLEWAKECEGVRFFTTCDSKDLSANIQAVLNYGKYEYLQAGKANHEFVAKGFSAIRWAQDIVEFYGKLW